MEVLQTRKMLSDRISKTMNLNEGDIFTLPIDSESVGFGQVVCIPNKNNFIVAIFDVKSNEKDIPSLSKIVAKDIILFGYTMDAKLYHNHWKIIGNETSNIDKIKMPTYKLGTPPSDLFMTNHKGEIIREINVNEFEKLKYIKVVAPVRFEKATQAYYKKTEWKEQFNELIYPPAGASL